MESTHEHSPFMLMGLIFWRMAGKFSLEKALSLLAHIDKKPVA